MRACARTSNGSWPTDRQHAHSLSDPSPSITTPTKRRATHGLFVWLDIMSKDVETALSFYQQLFGWTLEERHMGPPAGTYRMLCGPNGPLGGIMSFNEPGTEQIPSHWLTYVAVDDCAAACKRAKEAGGAVCVPPFAIPDVGTMAILNDPDGGFVSAITLIEVEGDPDPAYPAPVGHIVWTELHAKKVEPSKDFYPKVFGWGWRERDMGEHGMYYEVENGERRFAGLMQNPMGEEGHQAWLSYVHVEDVDAIHARAQELGGKSCVSPADIPEVGRFAVLFDPTGAVFAVHRPVAQ